MALRSSSAFRQVCHVCTPVEPKASSVQKDPVGGASSLDRQRSLAALERQPLHLHPRCEPVR